MSESLRQEGALREIAEIIFNKIRNKFYNSIIRGDDDVMYC